MKYYKVGYMKGDTLIRRGDLTPMSHAKAITFRNKHSDPHNHILYEVEVKEGENVYD
jgi:hypothetical protein